MEDNMSIPNASVPQVMPSAPPVVAVPEALPPAAPVAAPQPPPVSAAAPPSQMEGGGSTATMDFFKSINWLEVTFMGLAAWALYNTIYYYKYKLREDRMCHADTQRQLDKQAQDIGNLQAANSQKQTQQPQFSDPMHN